MAKKIALLVTLVMMFTISCVFAAEAETPDLLSAPVSSETEVSGEEAVVDTESGEEAEAPETSGEEATPSEEQDATHEEENGNGAVVGAIIAVVIVVAIVAIVAILNKN